MIGPIGTFHGVFILLNLISFKNLIMGETHTSSFGFQILIYSIDNFAWLNLVQLENQYYWFINLDSMMCS
jgi:hypothetical protein